EMPALAASADMFCTKVLKSPPQRAAKAGVAAMKALRQTASEVGAWDSFIPPPCGEGRPALAGRGGGIQLT
ncbi:hypothetical protein, partial [Bradyrhizobium sp.]|uniref:hypothetical protein n=1 Tax=Bradyrhizobium sp. TaxID=376 RepID=UPI003C7D8000